MMSKLPTVGLIYGVIACTVFYLGFYKAFGRGSILILWAFRPETRRVTVGIVI